MIFLIINYYSERRAVRGILKLTSYALKDVKDCKLIIDSKIICLEIQYLLHAVELWYCETLDRGFSPLSILGSKMCEYCTC